MRLINFLRAVRLVWLIFITTPKVALLRLRRFNLGACCRIAWDSNWPFRGSSVEIGSNVNISAGVQLYTPAESGGRISIGTGSAIGRHTSISSLLFVEIGDYCVISDWVHISDSEHVTGTGINPVTSGLRPVASVWIGYGCFIGKGATILPGTVLGDYCVVGAGAVVRGTFKPGSVVVGVPAVSKGIK